MFNRRRPPDDFSAEIDAHLHPAHLSTLKMSVREWAGGFHSMDGIYDDDGAVIPEAFDAYGRRVLQVHVPKLIPVADEEAHRFGCNAVVVGKTVVHNSRCPKLAADLAGAGYTAVEVELDEFLKAGGSAKCLTLRIDGEEAANW